MAILSRWLFLNVMVLINFFLLFMIDILCAANEPFPLPYAIPGCKIVQEIPKKDRDFAFIIPGKMDTYIYDSEIDYYKDYQRAYFAVTCKKGGWDCLRHYEILANGCIPYFIDIDACPSNSMYFFPKKLIKEAMALEGVSLLKIDHSKFDETKYYSLLDRLLEYTKKHLTTESVANYFLNTIDYNGSEKILFFPEVRWINYTQSLLLIGLKELLGERVVDFPKLEHIYKSYPGNIRHLWGKGFTYTKIIEDQLIDRKNIRRRIIEKEFDVIIYAYAHSYLPYHDLVKCTYPQNKIIYLCGDDIHHCNLISWPNLFLREW